MANHAEDDREEREITYMHTHAEDDREEREITYMHTIMKK
jgi:hypothetical protein